MQSIKANLNYSVALIVAGSMIAIGWVSPHIKRFFLHPGKIDPIYYYINYIAIALVIILVIAIWWIKGSITPSPITPKARLLLRIGSVAMAIGNGAVALAFIVSLIGVAVNNEFGLAVGFIFAAAFMLAFPLDIVGIICVEMSRLLNRFNRFQSSLPQ